MLCWGITCKHVCIPCISVSVRSKNVNCCSPPGRAKQSWSYSGNIKVLSFSEKKKKETKELFRSVKHKHLVLVMELIWLFLTHKDNHTQWNWRPELCELTWESSNSLQTGNVHLLTSASTCEYSSSYINISVYLPKES